MRKNIDIPEEIVKDYKKKNVSFRLGANLRARISSALKKKTKVSSLTSVLGCSLAELKIHLESKFQEGMSWDNYGKYGWHIDHILPCASFNLEDFKQQEQCFHYTNLQPLWAKDNHRKSNKLLLT